MDEDAEDYGPEPMPSLRFQWLDVLILFFDAIGGVIRAVGGLFDGASEVLAMHSNWRADQDAMREQVHMDLESLPVEDGDER